MYRVKGADQKEYGPVSEDQMIEWIGESRLNRFSMAQKEGDPTWKSLDQFPEFSAALAVAKAPPPISTTRIPVADPERAVQLLNVPSLGLMVMGGIGLFIALSGFVGREWLLGMFLDLVKVAKIVLPPEQLEAFRNAQLQSPGIQEYGQGLMGIALNAVMISGALKMRRLENWNLCFAAAILSLTPCTCCCCVSIPFGVWSILILNRPEVKKSFR